MFTLARLWYLDCPTTFLYCHFFNGIPLGLKDQYQAVRIRFEPQKSILRSSYAKYTLLTRCVARKNHSAYFEAEIASTWQRISRHLRSLCVSSLHIVPWQNSLPWVGVGIFVSWASAEKKKKNQRTEISLLVIRKTDYFCCIFISCYWPCNKNISFWDVILFPFPKRHYLNYLTPTKSVFSQDNCAYPPLKSWQRVHLKQ